MDSLDFLRFTTPTKVDWNATREAIVWVIVSKHLVHATLSQAAFIEQTMKEARKFVRKYSPGTAYRMQSERKNEND